MKYCKRKIELWQAESKNGEIGNGKRLNIIKKNREKVKDCDRWKGKVGGIIIKVLKTLRKKGTRTSMRNQFDSFDKTKNLQVLNSIRT